MDENAVGHRRKTRGNFHSGSDDAGFGTRNREFFHVLADKRAHRRDRTRKSQPEAIENGFPSQRQHFFRNVFIFRICDELANVLRQARYIRELPRTFLRLQRRCGRRNHPKRTSKELTPFHARFPPEGCTVALFYADSRRNASKSLLTCSGCSCCTQWPAPSSR